MECEPALMPALHKTIKLNPKKSVEELYEMIAQGACLKLDGAKVKLEVR